MSKKPVIAVITYSTWGHVDALAESVIKGIQASGATVKPYAFKETLPAEVLTKMYAGKSLNPKYPIITPDDLKDVDGIVIGAPTRYGRVPAQVSAFFDSCGQLWQTGALVGKFVTQFTAAGGQHGGHETTALTSMPFYVHMGLVYVPIGYGNKTLFDVETVQGGAPWGASTVSGADGSRQSLASELQVAEYQGKYFADFVGTFTRGKYLQSTTTISSKVLPKISPSRAAEQTDGQGYDMNSNNGSAGAGAHGRSSQRDREPKRKSGLFAKCCRDDGIDN